MAVINFAHREITAKVVYFGATGAGCNTNVRALYERVDSAKKSRLHKFGPGEALERSWYFDLKSDRTEITGFSVRLRVYSMPGGLLLEAHRKEVMDQVDAIVLVADSRQSAATANEEALMELEQILADQGLELAAMPVVLQVNQTDREGAREESAVVFDLNPYGFPVFSAAAKSGIGVRDTFDAIVETTLARIRDNMAGGDGAITLTAVHRPETEDDSATIKRHLAAIHAETDEPLASSSLDEDPPATPVPPSDEVEVPFQPRAFAGSYPVRVMGADLSDGQVYIDIELERMGGGELRQLRVKLANRPTDVPAPARTDSTLTPHRPVAGITDHLPDKVEIHGLEATGDMPPVWYGILGVTGGIIAGLLLGFLLLH